MTTDERETMIGTVAALRRYPVKSMLGQELTSAEITPRGLRGDRAFAVVDAADGRVATAKNPRKWPDMFRFHSTLATEHVGDPALRITLPDGTLVAGDDCDRDHVLSQAVGRAVSLQSISDRSAATAAVTSEAFWPEVEGLTKHGVTEFELTEGTFFDSGLIHLVTTSTLKRLGELYPEGCFEVSRFRPNVLVETFDGIDGFAENEWPGQTLAIGGEVQLVVTKACSRCVMTTLPQEGLPRDLGILRAVVKHNDAKVGFYASVARSGTIHRGDAIIRRDPT